MKKKIFILIFISLCISFLLFFRIPILDRFNPFLSNDISYAKVSKDTQTYNNITIYNSNGEKFSYKLNFIGYDPTNEYVKIDHKGKYVKRIEYITKNSEIPKWLK